MSGSHDAVGENTLSSFFSSIAGLQLDNMPQTSLEDREIPGSPNFVWQRVVRRPKTRRQRHFICRGEPELLIMHSGPIADREGGEMFYIRWGYRDWSYYSVRIPCWGILPYHKVRPVAVRVTRDGIAGPSVSVILTTGHKCASGTTVCRVAEHYMCCFEAPEPCRRMLFWTKVPNIAPVLCEETPGASPTYTTLPITGMDDGCVSLYRSGSRDVLALIKNGRKIAHLRLDYHRVVSARFDQVLPLQPQYSRIVVTVASRLYPTAAGFHTMATLMFWPANTNQNDWRSAEAGLQQLAAKEW